MALPQVSPFGRLLKRARRAAVLTQEAFAAQVGYSPSYIGMLERGERTPAPATVTLFAEALGVSASERTAWLAAAEQQHQASLALPAPASPALAGPPLVGRVAERAVIEQHLRGSGPPVLVLAGEPGIGKSRLLAEATARAEAVGWEVLSGGCHRRSGQDPYAPLLEALARHLHRQAPAQQQRHLKGCAWLVRLLPELAENRLVPTPAWTLPPEQERRLLFAAVARYLSNVACPLGTLLVLDDLQWAGADALDLLSSLLRAPGERPLRVVGAYRSTEVRPSDPLGALLADLGPTELATQLPLGPLAPTEARDLLDSVLTGEEVVEHTLREHLLARTGGVPFFLVSCAQALRVPGPVGTDQRIPWDVTQSIRQRVAALPYAAQELLDAAAIAGRSVPRSLLVTVAGAFGQSQREVLFALEAACQARLLLEAGTVAYAFPHDLVRDVLLADLSAARRAALHQQVAEAVEQVPQRRREGRAAELAWHWLEAGDAERALPYALLAGEQAEAVYAHQDAEQHYQTARALAHELNDQRREAEALEQLSLPLRFLGRYAEALSAAEAALALYQALGEVEGQGRALALIGHLHVSAETTAAGVARVQPLVAPLCTAGLSLSRQCVLYAALARLYYNLAERGTSAQRSEALSVAEQAEALALQAKNERLVGLAKSRRGVALLSLEREEEGAQVLSDAIRLLEASGDLEELGVALHNLSNFYHERGKYDLALAGTERALALVERLGNLEEIVLQKQRRGDLLFDLGQWKRARQDLEQAATFLGEERRSWPLVWSHQTLGLLELAQGQVGAAAEHLQRSLALSERSEDPVSWLWAACAVAYQNLVEGRPQAARARLNPFLDRFSLRAYERAWVRHLLGWACVELGDLERAEVLLAEASTLARAHLPCWVVLGVLHSQVRLALRQDRGPEAEQALTEALALSQAMGLPYQEAQTLYLSGRLHLQRGETQPARERLEAALAILHRLGERLYAEQVERALAHLGPQQ